MTILTNYRPNFCCQCGQKIVRLRWHVWTSRRFCDKCLHAFAKTQWLRPSLSLFTLLLFGVLVLPRISAHREMPLSRTTRTVGVALAFLCVSAYLAYPFLRP